jgi:amino acid transporter
VLIFDFVELLVLGALVSVPTYLLTFACPIVLRWKRPDLRGPFRIPGGWPVLIPAALVPSLIAIYLVVAASPTERIGAALFIGSAPLVYFAARRYNLYLGIDSNAPNPSVAVDRLLGVRPDQDSEHGEK